MNKITRRAAAITVVGAVVFSGLGMAQVANASAITPAGNIALHGPISGTTAGTGAVLTTGSATSSRMFNGITVDQGCPAGYRYSSNTLVFQGGVNHGAIATTRLQSTTAYGMTGLDGNPIAMDESYTVPGTSNFANNKNLSALASPIAAGAFEVRVYCFAGVNADFVNDKWFSLPLVLSSDLSTWSTPVVKTATTASLTAASNANKTITLTATVKAAGATATAAVGNCNFYDAANTLVGSGTVASGVGTFTTGVMAAGSYSYTAQFVGTNDVNYNDSAVSGSATAYVAGANASTVTVAIPAGQGSVMLSGVATSVDLGTAVLSGGMLTATGQLGSLTVTDSRQTDAAAWNLTGQTSDFTVGTKSFSGKYLGWTPALVGSTNAGTAGAAVLPGTTGLKTASVLATGSVVSGQTTTTTGATLNLAVPSNTPSGAYTAVLTLTLA
ncbi:MAG: hypothetical protein H7248_09980 [Microbacteriaceae bacterium]|nr:hypothetical protein [Microbacteriaceae bacterium]